MSIVSRPAPGVIRGIVSHKPFAATARIRDIRRLSAQYTQRTFGPAPRLVSQPLP